MRMITCVKLVCAYAFSIISQNCCFVLELLLVLSRCASPQPTQLLSKSTPACLPIKANLSTNRITSEGPKIMNRAFGRRIQFWTVYVSSDVIWKAISKNRSNRSHIRRPSRQEFSLQRAFSAWSQVRRSSFGSLAN